MVDLGGFYCRGNWREIIETHKPCLEIGWWTNRSTDVVAQEMLGGGASRLNHSSDTTLATAMARALDLFPETTWRHKRHGSHPRDGVAAVQRTTALQSSLSKSNLASDTYMWSWLSLRLMLAPLISSGSSAKWRSPRQFEMKWVHFPYVGLSSSDLVSGFQYQPSQIDPVSYCSIFACSLHVSNGDS